MDSNANRFQILALDGGGIKGLFSAAILAALENDLNIDITNHFDLITGTSTGGIIAIGLGLGMRPKDIVKFYVDNGPAIFKNPFKLRCFLQWISMKYSQKPLLTALKDNSAFGDRLLGDSKKRLVIPSFNLGEDDVYIFKTPHHERFRRDWKVPMWKVALATSAAPTFFPCCKHVDKMRLVDGGIWANNPTLVGIIEAIGILKVKLDTISVFSLGTTDEVNHRSRMLDKSGFLRWIIPHGDAIDIIMQGQSIGVFKQAQLLLGANNVERLNPKVPKGLFALDRLNADELISKAAYFSRIFCPTFEKKFIEHIAPLYQPLYPKSDLGE